jgi:glutamate carboxypeptidase
MEDRRAEFVDVLGNLVAVDSGTFTPEGVNKVADLCEERFNAHGWDVERRSHVPVNGEEQLGDLLVGRIGDAGPRVLMIGHMDTVFPEGTVAERPFAVEGERALGPGVCDMKSGLLGGFFAVELLLEAGSPPARVTYVCNPDEEIGSTFSRAAIEELAADADVAFVLEPARGNGELVTARKGVTDMRIVVAGRAAHAGVEPHRGASAVLEAANKVIQLHELNGQWPGVTVNAGVLRGGTRPNVVADRCEIHVDIRAPGEEALQAAEAAATRIGQGSTVPGTSSAVRLAANHRPMERTEASARLLGLAQAVAGELGFEVGERATGGASDANTTSAAGVPTLDGLGPIGGAAHSASEWTDLTSVVPRIALLAGLIAAVGEGRWN